MAILDPIKANVLAVRIIPNVDRGFAEKMNLRENERSVGFLTADLDDATYAAIDEATKQADVRVAYAKSFYAGSGHASGPLSGEIIAILAGPDPAEARAGLNAALTYIRDEAYFYSANDNNSIAFFPHLISRTGSYLSETAGVPVGTPMAYLIAPPLEATFGIDAALKAANVTMRVWFNPPSETNFSGALLTGDQAACRAACRAFQDAVLDVARNPLKF
ncbi:MAG: microcompartment protein EutL [Chloroflexi bacterium UTCFX4]|jgi:ethanolamine utilization protein EutL|nr:MAG: microcompartment protein EutL [Chloroflexi bacterium UTCFX4]